MAGLSITRRRKAWLKGVLCGATGRGAGLYQLPKLQDIFRRGMDFGRANADAPTVRSLVDQFKRKTAPRAAAPRDRDRRRPRRPGGRFGGP